MVRQYLLTHDITACRSRVDDFGTDVEAALAAYASAEQLHRDDRTVEVVLLGSDSIKTLERTHSSYFDIGHKHVDRLVARDLAELGLI